MALDLIMAIEKLDVLVVDDKEFVKEPLIHALERKGYQVDSVDLCSEGIEKVSKNPYRYSGIITDLNQHPSGLDLINAVREVNPDVPIIVWTGYAPDHMRKGVIERVGEDCLYQKPVRIPEIVQKLESLIKPTIDAKNPTASIFHRDENTRKIYQEQLELAGYAPQAHDVGVDTTPADIVNKVIEDNPSVVFLAVNYLPYGHGQAGFKGLKALKSDERTRNIPVVMVSGDLNYKAISTRECANDFLQASDMEQLRKLANTYKPQS